jgi:uncharacterized membrane protein YkoI
MINRFKVNQIMVFTFAALIVSTLVQAEEIKKEAVPPAVIASFEKSYPAATIKSYEREDRGGETCYEIESTEGTIERDIIYSAGGGVLEIEESLDVKQLPERVRKSVEKNHSQGKILSAEKVTQGKDITYELIVQSGEKKLEMEIDAYGGMISSKKIEHD